MGRWRAILRRRPGPRAQLRTRTGRRCDVPRERCPTTPSAPAFYEIPITSPWPSSRKPMPPVALQPGQKFRWAPWKCTGISFRAPTGSPEKRLHRNQGRNEEYLHDGHSDAGAGLRLLRPCDRLHLRLRTALKGRTMIFDYSLAGAVSLGLLFYLTYALLRPERF